MSRGDQGLDCFLEDCCGDPFTVMIDHNGIEFPNAESILAFSDLTHDTCSLAPEVVQHASVNAVLTAQNGEKYHFSFTVAHEDEEAPGLEFVEAVQKTLANRIAEYLSKGPEESKNDCATRQLRLLAMKKCVLNDFEAAKDGSLFSFNPHLLNEVTTKKRFGFLLMSDETVDCVSEHDMVKEHLQGSHRCEFHKTPMQDFCLAEQCQLCLGDPGASASESESESDSESESESESDIAGDKPGELGGSKDESGDSGDSESSADSEDDGSGEEDEEEEKEEPHTKGAKVYCEKRPNHLLVPLSMVFNQGDQGIEHNRQPFPVYPNLVYQAFCEENISYLSEFFRKRALAALGKHLKTKDQRKKLKDSMRVELVGFGESWVDYYPSTSEPYVFKLRVAEALALVHFGHIFSQVCNAFQRQAVAEVGKEMGFKKEKQFVKVNEIMEQMAINDHPCNVVVLDEEGKTSDFSSFADFQ